jgi:hypothetical protein
MPRYECDDCEDWEEMPVDDFKEGMHCECGSHLFLKLFDHYREHTKLCYKCKNYATVLCMTCKHYKDR